MAINLLSYTGNAGLGVGSSDIPVTPTNPNLDVINDTLRNVMLMDNQRNVQLFQQKIRDRDQLTEMIMKNQVSSGDILPEYRKHFDQAEKQAEAAFSDWGGNLNDKDGYRKYQAAIQDLRDISAHAQGKTMGIRALEQQKAKEVLPRKQQELKKWIDQESAKPFWDSVTPYQQLHDFSIDDIVGDVKPVTTVTRDAKDPTISYDTTYFDYNDILRKKRNQYINDQNAADSIDQLFDKLQRLPFNQLVPTLDAMDAQLDRYNQERGLNPGDRGYVEKIKRAGVGGQVLINEPKTEFAAKYALSQQPQFVTRTPKFDKDIAKYGIDKAKLGLQAKKLGIDAAKAGAYIRNLNTKTDKFVRDQIAVGTDVSAQINEMITKARPEGIVISNAGGVKGKTEKIDALFMDELPQSYQSIGGPIMALDSKGNPTGKITVGQLIPFRSSNGRSYYIPKYLDNQTGEEVNKKNLPTDIRQAYESANKKRKISIDDFFKFLQKRGDIDVIWKGQNNTAANVSSIIRSAKAINAAATTKGEENIMNPPDSSPSEPD
jgi:hypothetical protein